MTERQIQIQSPEARVINLYNRVLMLTDKYGHKVESMGKSKKEWHQFSISLGEDGNRSEFFATLSSGYATGEAKLIYEVKKVNGLLDRQEVTFRENGSASRRVLRGELSKGSLDPVLPGKRITNHEIDSFKKIIDNIESKLENHGESSIITNLHINSDAKHRHFIRIKRRRAKD